MKQSLQFKLGQQLVMTPQLQQSIKLLQLSTLELQQEICEVLETNPLLETTEEYDARAPDEAKSDTRNRLAPADPDTSPDDELGIPLENAAGAPALASAIPPGLSPDSEWEDVYRAPGGNSSGMAGPVPDVDGPGDGRESLHDHLMWQLNLAHMSDLERLIGLAIIDATDSNGRLVAGTEELWQSFDPELGIGRDQVMAVLRHLQQFDPPGICSRDLRESLLVQLQQLPADTPYRSEARLLVRAHLQLLANRNYPQLMRRSRLCEPDLKQALALLQSLSPNPGENFGADTTEYIVPDVIVSRQDGSWLVALNSDIAPRLRINQHYAGLIKRANDSAANTWLRDHLKDARWFLRSLQNRNETLLAVASRIVEHQSDFLDHGAEAMKPLVLHEIAAATDLHESTISRVTRQKYMHTPRGIYELKYFFSSHVSTSGGGECSSTAIRALIKKLIAEETPRKPLSDNKISSMLAQQGIEVARRTITKYRESLLIPSSNERRRLA